MNEILAIARAHDAAEGLWLLPLFLVGLYLWISFIGLVIAQVGGWANLARKYRAGPRPAEGVTYRWRSGRTAWLAHYNSSLNVTLTRAGCYVATVWIFRWSHAPLLLPWDRLEAVTPTRLFFWRFLALRFADTEGRTLTVNMPERARANLAELSGRGDLLTLSAR